MNSLLIAVVSGVSTAILLWLLLRTRLGSVFIDKPNERSLHETPTPRVGGLAITSIVLISALVYMGIAADNSVVTHTISWLLFSGVAALAMLGMIDDRAGLGAAVRALIHLIVAVGFITVLASASSVTLSIAIATVAVLTIGWCANLFNFMDGADGLIGLTSLVGFSTLAWLAPSGSLVNWTCATLAGACAGFLIFNWPPARTFLGDAGSVPIGFLAAALGLIGVFRGYWQWWIPIMCFLPLIIDSTVTLTHRVLRGQKPWQAHREHWYQRLILSGLSHRRVAIYYGIASLICGIVAATTRY